MNCGSTTDTRRTKIEKFITYKSWRKCLAHLEGPRGEVKAECRERQTLGHVFIRVCRWSALGFPGLRLDWSIETKRAGFDKPQWSLI